MEHLSFKPIFFESLGAKSSATLVTTKDVRVLIDPGIAALQTGFPAPKKAKSSWEREGKKAIKQASREADVVIISHYHYDHFLPKDLDMYEGKVLLIKNPNEYINDSQRVRAKNFLELLCRRFAKKSLDNFLKEKKERSYRDTFEELETSPRISLGAYDRRRKHLIEVGKKWFEARVKKWNEYMEIPEVKLGDTEVRFPEGREFVFGKTKLRFTNPLFHGVEYSRVGWVFATVVECRGEKLIHSSDVDGPVIEDYAEWIIREDPDVLILDGASTYMLGYMLNVTNLKRAVRNACKIVSEIKSELILYDHHLLRDVRYRDRTKEVWDTGKSKVKNLLTVAEYLGKVPVADMFAKKPH